jgi:amino acid adenylation domain-containing protein
MKTVVEDIYPLSPAQHGMLFHALYAPAADMYVHQLVCEIEGYVDEQAFQDAWSALAQRHPVLRTSFLWEDLEKPLQIVSSSVSLDFLAEDWRDLAGQQEERWREHLQADRKHAFDLGKAPLLRVFLVRLSDRGYRLLWTHHHIILDGWSVAAALDELRILYQEHCTGVPARLPTPILYRNFIAWLQQQNPARALDFWRAQMEGVERPTCLAELICSMHKGDEDEYQGAEFVFSREWTLRLTRWVQEQHLTLSTLIHGAWAILLRRYGAGNDVIFGSVTSGRPPELEGVESILGLLINTLPLRVQIDPETEIADWLAHLQARQMEIYEHAHVSLADIQNENSVSGGQALFDTILVFENYPFQQTTGGAEGHLNFREVRGYGRTNYGLTLMVLPVPELTIRVRYCTASFSPNVVQQLLQDFKHLILQVASDGRQRIGQITALAAEHRKRLLADWNAPERSRDRGTCIHRLFEERAAEAPGDIAVVFENMRITWNRLNARANQLARCLQAFGVHPEVIVGLHLKRNISLVLGALATLKAGGTYVPLDPGLPPERLSLILGDSLPRVVLTETALQDSLARSGSSGFTLLNLDEAVLDGFSAANLNIADLPQSAAYIIYTSGSTGRPKGVVIEHQQVLNYLEGVNERAGWPRGANFALVQPLSVDSSVTVFYSALCLGGCLHVISEELSSDPEKLGECFEHERIDCLKIAPSHLAALLQSSRQPSKLLPGSRLIVGGEGSRWEWLKGVQRMKGEAVVFNHYGPTETTVGVLMYRMPKEDTDGPRAMVPLGRPMLNVRAYVLDTDGELVPTGVTGELFIGGLAVGRGYLNQPSLTAERYIPDPFAPVPGSRFYRTGDLARWRSDGELEFLGRKDQQVKIRGYRIELGEIEAVLGRHKGIKECLVTTKEHDTGERFLVAYVVWMDGAQRDLQGLQAKLKEHLPDYMFPAAWMELSRLPLSRHGKVDLSALPEPQAAWQRKSGYVVPRTPAEEMLASIWAEVMNLPRVGPHDNFFELGGNSLIAMQVISRVRQVFQIEIPLRALFEFSTVAGFAEVMESRMQSDSTLQVPPIQHVPERAEMPLSFAQERLFFLQNFELESSHYNIQLPLRLKGSLDQAALEQALHHLIQRHQGLRIRFALADGRLFQVIEPGDPCKLDYLDLRRMPESERAGALESALRQEGHTVFDLTQGTPLRMCLILLEENEHVLSFTLHHILGDGWSMNVLFHELWTLYDSHVRGEKCLLPELPVQYTDYACWQREWLQGGALETELTFWRKQLEGLASLELPQSRQPHGLRHRGACERLRLERELVSELRQVGRSAGSTLFMTLLAGFNLLLQRYSGSTDIVTGIPIAGRTRKETEGLAGVFVNTLPLRIRLCGNPPVSELLELVRQTALDCYAHQYVPFEKLVHELHPERNLDRNPIFQVVFVMQVAPRASLKLRELDISEVELEPDSTRFDLTLSVVEAEDGSVTGWLEYDPDVRDAEMIRRMARHWRNLLRAMVLDACRRISELEMLEPVEREQLLRAPDPAGPGKPVRTIHQAFTEQTKRDAYACALVNEEGREMSYGELERRSNQMAHFLKAQGAGPETLAGICLDRSLELIIAILGVLKTGAAYVPLDPNYPPERLRYMLEDSQASILITQKTLSARLTEFAGTIVRMDDDWSGMAHENYAELKLPEMSAQHAAYVIYTSGSTGKPKGCVVTHGNVMRLLQATETGFSFGPGDTWTLFHSAAFDFSVWEIFGALLHGSRLVIMSYWTNRSPSEFLGLIRQRKVTVLNMTPSAFWPLLRELTSGPEEGLSLRVVIFGGETLDFRLLQKWYERYPHGGPQFVNMYGITETTVHVTFREVTRSCVAEDEGSRIGTPAPGISVYLMDKSLNPVPAGVPGEICVGGSGVTRGYWHRPDLTAERFIPDSFSGVPGARLYRSGDLARWVEHEGEWELEYLGRGDQQVKIRGFRIELGEIAAELRAQRGVQDAVVLVEDDARAGAQIAAYVVAAEDHLLEPALLRQELRQGLPEYMIPSRWAVVQKLPLNVNGKFDPSALPPAGPVQEAGSVSQGPQDALERIVWKAWLAELPGNAIGRHSSFFDIGGHSISAARLITRINSLFHIRLAIRSIFEYPTPESFSEEVRRTVLKSSAVMSHPALARRVLKAGAPEVK